MKLLYSTFTLAGERGDNEDSVLVIERSKVTAFLVADGLGGHGGGAAASQAVVDCIDKHIDDNASFSAALIGECFIHAQERLMELQKQAGSDGMKSTLTMLLTDGKQAAWAHIGDSRLYHFRGKRMISRTIDHSIAQTLVALGDISEAELKTSPDRNQLTRVLGVECDEPRYNIDHRSYRLRRRDVFVICSDGLWERMDEKAAAAVLREGLIDEALKKLCTQAIETESERRRDDISAIAIRVV